MCENNIESSQLQKMSISKIVHCSDDNHETAIMKASRNKSPKCLEYLLSNKTMLKQLHFRNVDSSTALHLAVLCQNVKNVELLVQKFNMSKIYQDDKGNIPLHYASQLNSTKILHQLLTSEGGLEIENYDSQTPAHLLLLSKEYLEEKITTFQTFKKSDWNYLITKACEIPDLHPMDTLLKMCKHKDIYPLVVFLEHSLIYQNSQTSSHFLKLGASPNVILKENKTTPIVIAIQYGLPKLVDEMLDKGAFDIFDSKGINGVIAAAGVDDFTTLEKLLKLNFGTKSPQNSALYQAVCHKSNKCIDTLLRHGVGVLTQNINMSDIDSNLSSKLQAAGLQKCQPTDKLYQPENNVHSLKEICRQRIRMTFNLNETNCFYCVHKIINLPKQLKLYLLFGEMLD